MLGILHVDMDQFYAAVEMRDDPSLKGRPVVIGSDPKQGRGRGVVSTANYLARRFGVHSAMPISQAYRLCPQAAFIEPDMAKYARASEKIHAVFHRYTPLVEPLSLDEAFLDVRASRLLFGDADCKAAWDTSNNAIIKYLYRKTTKGSFFTRVDMNTGKETHPLYGALDAFYAGVLTLSGNLMLAENIQQGNTYMWAKFHIEPEEFNFKTDSVTSPEYELRPENMESCFYLYRATKDEQYLRMAKKMTDDILSKCRTEDGFAAIKDVRTMELKDSMESFFLAETLKYAYLIFAPESTLDLKNYVFTTEAHPFKIVR